ncbi:hypothetical protein H5410_050765 [Solanum commersonii]|uniref:Uncharacterized protein n=1 Tax=Solanum commersonii TaxID=4109 RepID=A0A9J5WWH7_SOLCO|nr:hypothetical protein H5410_050765 [Solanum commersonii]
MMSEWLFDGDLPEGKVTKSNILATLEEWLVQSLASLKGFIQLPFSEDECKSPDPILNKFNPVFHQTYDIVEPINASQREYVKNDEDIPLSWTRKGVRGAHTLKQPLLTLKEVVLILKPKVLNDLGPMKLSLRITRANKKSPAKKARVKTKVASKPEPVWGLVYLQKPKEKEKVLTKEERIAVLKKQKVLNGRVFDLDILTEPGMFSLFDFVAWQRWEHMFECPVPFLHES